MVLALLGSMCLRYEDGIPIVSSNSRAISAACHPAPGMRASGESTKKLQYGVIASLGNGKYHVGFSSANVTPLVPGAHYE